MGVDGDEHFSSLLFASLVLYCVGVQERVMPPLEAALAS
jgi:hypothetical protein